MATVPISGKMSCGVWHGARELWKEELCERLGKSEDENTHKHTPLTSLIFRCNFNSLVNERVPHRRFSRGNGGRSHKRKECIPLVCVLHTSTVAVIRTYIYTYHTHVGAGVLWLFISTKALCGRYAYPSTRSTTSLPGLRDLDVFKYACHVDEMGG